MESKDLQHLKELEMLLRTNKLSPPYSTENEIALNDLWAVIWRGKWLIVAVSVLFSLASIAYALSQPNIYKASVLLAPANSDGGVGGLSKLAGQFGGLASLAGINLGDSSSDKVSLALAVLKSRKFIEDFVDDNGLLVPLIAAERWDVETEELIIDPKIYNETTKAWVREVSYPKTVVPSPWESFETFNELFSVYQDKDSGMVSIEVEYYSAEMAKEWLFLIVKNLNETVREQDRKEAQDSIEFLTRKLKQTQLSGMQNVFYQLIEEQTKTMMLAEVSDEYVFKVIDPPNAPDEKAKPRRGVIVVMFTLIGCCLSIMFLLIRFFISSAYQSNKVPLEINGGS